MTCDLSTILHYCKATFNARKLKSDIANVYKLFDTEYVIEKCLAFHERVWTLLSSERLETAILFIHEIFADFDEHSSMRWWPMPNKHPEYIVF